MAKFNSGWLFFFILFSAKAGWAQPPGREVVNQPIQWIAITTNLKFTPRTSLMLEGQFRQAKQFQPMQYQFRTGVEIAVSKHLFIVPVGYVYTWNHLYGKQPSSFENNEHRFWEQVSYKHHLGRLHFTHRLRLEQRFIQVHTRISDNEIVNEGYDQYLNRLRYRIHATFPFKGDKVEPKSYFASVYDEAFLSWGKGVTFHEPDQNRIFAGLGYQFGEALSIQGGFLYQMLIKSNGARQENNVGALVQVNYNIDIFGQER